MVWYNMKLIKSGGGW